MKRKDAEAAECNPPSSAADNQELSCDVSPSGGKETHSEAQHGEAQHGEAQHGEAQHSEAQHSEAQHSEAVVRLYSQHQRWLFGYLVTLLGNPEDAEDVMQEVSVVMWREHRNFELGTNFTGWLSVIAYHQVQKFWRNRKRNATYLDISVIDQLASVITKDREIVDIRRQFLGECLENLPNKDRDLVETVYSSEGPGKIRRFAQKSGVEEAGFYRSLARIRKALFNCVQRKLAAEGISG